MYLVESRGQRLPIWGGVVHVAPIQFPDTGATMKYDSNDADARATRERLCQQATQERLLIGAAHIAFPGLGHVRRHGDAYDWLPLNYDAAPGTAN